MSNDGSLSGNKAAVATGSTNSNQLAVSDSSPVMANVPLPDRPTPEASQAPPTADSKYEKTNLKDQLQHKKVVTRTMVQTGVAVNHRRDYANYEVPIQGVTNSTNKPTVRKTDLTSLRSKLEKTKEEREKTVVASANTKAVVASANTKTNKDYYNLPDITAYVSENPVTISNPPDRKPMAVPRTITPANLAGGNTHFSSSKKTYRLSLYVFFDEEKCLWQCAKCQEINEAQHATCKYCKLLRGLMADRSAICEFCQLMIFIPAAKGVYSDVCCRRCKQVHETAF